MIPAVRLRLVAIALCLCSFARTAVAINQILSTGCQASHAEQACVNLGPRRATAGPFMRMKSNVQLPSTDLKVYRLGTTVTETDYPAIFKRHFRSKDLTLGFNVPPLRTFDVSLHTTESRFCSRRGVTAWIEAGTNVATSNTVNGLKSFGCHIAFTITAFGAISDSNGLLQVRVRGNRGVVIAGMCIRRRLMEPTFCTQPGCVSFDGCGGLAVANASLAIPGSPCDILPSGQDTLRIPDGSQIVYAALNWAGAGHPRAPSTAIVINGKTVVSDMLHQDAQFEPYYTAMADVTQLVQQIGAAEYVVTSMFHSPYLSCPQAHMAAWSLTVVYGAMGLTSDGSKVRVNVCAENSVGSPPLVTLPINCVLPAPPAVDTSVLFVAFESEFYVDQMQLNGKFFKKNWFKGRSGEKFDVLQENISKFVGSDTEQLVFTLDDNPENDFLFIAVRAVVQTLPSTYASSSTRFARVVRAPNTNPQLRTQRLSLPARASL